MLQLVASSRQLMLCHQTFSEFIPITPIKSVVSNLAEDSLWGWVKTAKKTTATKENESEKLCIRVNSKKPGSSFQHHKQLWKFCVIITGVGGGTQEWSNTLQSKFLQISAVNAGTAVLTSHLAGPGRAYTPKYWVLWHGEVSEGN